MKNKLNDFLIKYEKEDNNKEISLTRNISVRTADNFAVLRYHMYQDKYIIFQIEDNRFSISSSSIPLSTFTSKAKNGLNVNTKVIKEFLNCFNISPRIFLNISSIIM